MVMLRLLFVIFFQLISLNVFAFAARQTNTQGFYDIYLTQRRICRQCSMQLLPDNRRVLLTNQTGEEKPYFVYEIMGVDYHPWRRRFLKRFVHGFPVPGRILFPHSHPDSKEYQDDVWEQ